MPTLAQATAPANLEGYSPVFPTPSPIGAVAPTFVPGYNVFLRCNLPPTPVTPDSLRQFYLGGQVPQNRIMTPPPLGQATGNSAITNNAINIVTPASAIKPTNVGTVQLASVTTPSLSPGQTYQTTLKTSRMFAPITVSVSTPARIELYATALAQTLDFGRAGTTAPGPGTFQGLLLDVNLDTSPLSWLVSPTLPSANGDSPQNPLSYLSLTNLSAGVAAITATVQYLVMEQ